METACDPQSKRAYLIRPKSLTAYPWILWAQCRCDKSLVDDAKALRDAFIGGELQKIKDFVTQSSDLKVTMAMQSFINKNKQVRLDEYQHRVTQ